MADKKTNDTPTVDVEIGGTKETGFEAEGGDVALDPSDVLMSSVDEEDEEKEADDVGDSDTLPEDDGGDEADEPADAASGDEGEAEKPEDAGEQPEALPDLGDYTPDKLTTFNERYTDSTGLLNMDVLEQEAAANFSKDGKVVLNKGTVDFIIQTRGLPREEVEFHIQKKLEARQAGWDQFVNDLGGSELLTSAQKWAEGAYTQAQKDAFNKLLKQTSAEAADKLRTEIELMVSRYQRANPAKKGEPKAKPKDYAKSAPAAKSAAASEGYASEDDERTALRTINKIDDPKKRAKAMNEHNAKIKASAYFKKGSA